MFYRNSLIDPIAPRHGLFVALAAAMALASGPVSAAQVSSGNDTVSLTLSGQVNRAIMLSDDGTNSEMDFVDNSYSSTRFRIVGEGQIDTNLSIGTQLEMGVVSNPSSAATIGAGGGGGGAGAGVGFEARKSELFVEHRRFGKLWLGYGDTASTGASTVDLSGTEVAANSGIQDGSGGLVFVASAVSVGQAYDNFDGLGRADRVRYDSPNFSGFTGSVSHLGAGVMDFGARYAGDMGSMKVAAAAGYAIGGNDILSASGSVILRSGLNFTAALGQQDNPAGNSPYFWYVKGGYNSGNHAISLDLGQASDVTLDATLSTVGVAYVRKYSEAGTDLYIALRGHSLDDINNSDAVMTMLTGARVKF